MVTRPTHCPHCSKNLTVTLATTEEEPIWLNESTICPHCETRVESEYALHPHQEEPLRNYGMVMDNRRWGGHETISEDARKRMATFLGPVHMRRLDRNKKICITVRDNGNHDMFTNMREDLMIRQRYSIKRERYPDRAISRFTIKDNSQ